MHHLNAIDIGGILVAIIAALGAWLSQRAASRATFTNTTVASRLDAEKEAYNRARAFDLQTIERQDSELTELRKDNKQLYERVAVLQERIARLESTRPISLTHLEELINEYDDKRGKPHPIADQEQQDL